MAPKTVGLIGAACLSAGWLVASLLAPPVARLQGLRARPTDDARRAEVTPVETTPVLQLEWRRTNEPPVPRRNPFVFGRRGVATSEPGMGAAAVNGRADPLLPPPAPRVMPPPYSLSGVAVSGDVRTAVLSDGVTVHLATAGQKVGLYSVVAVADDSVTLADAAGERFVIRLR